MKTAESLGYTLGLFRSFQKEGIFEIGDNSKRFSDELTDEEVFEYLVYLELHLLGLKPAALKRISSYFHRYAMEGAVESFRENSWGPSGTRRIFELVESGKTCFILVDHTGVLRIFEDEMFFATFMKGWYLLDSPTHVILSANKLLKRLGISVKRKRNTRLKRTLDKELRARFEGKEYELVNLDPKTAKIHELLKMPNKQIIAHTNDVGEITAIQEMRALRNDRKW